MKVKEVLLKSVKPYKNNPRKKTDAGIDEVAKTIKEFGWQQPIVVDKDMVIIAGHSRYYAAQKLNMKTVPVKIADELTEEQARAYRIADNRTNEFSEWDKDLLMGEFEEMEEYTPEFLSFEMAKVDEKSKEDEWDFSEVEDESVITIRVPVAEQSKILAKLKGIDPSRINITNLKSRAKT